MRRVLITGLTGFAGSHLAELLVNLGGYAVFGTIFGETKVVTGLPKEQAIKLDLRDKEATLRVVKEVDPEWIFHLAALTSPAQSFADPTGVITNNIEAQINLLEAARKLTGIKKILVVGSAEEYGKVSLSGLPINENVPLKPLNPYAVSKISQDFLGLQYYLSYKLPVVRVRPFNHTGERQPPLFVVPAFAKQIAEIEAGLLEPVVKVGNLEAIRDFTDVKDMVRAYVLAVEKGEEGEVYNLGSGRGVKIRQVLGELLALAKKPIRVEQDPARLMPVDVPQLVGDSRKFYNLTGWQPQIAFRETLARVLDYWRSKI